MTNSDNSLWEALKNTTACYHEEDGKSGVCGICGRKIRWYLPPKEKAKTENNE